MSSVNLRIVGIYARISVPFFGPIPLATVADLLVAASLVDTNFTYALNPPRGDDSQSLLTASYNWKMSPPSLGRKAGREPREIGLYSITEDPKPSATGVRTVWQYYIERPLASDPSYRQLVSKTPIGGGFKFVNQSEPLQANDEVIFRCVAIALSPA